MSGDLPHDASNREIVLAMNNLIRELRAMRAELNENYVRRDVFLEKEKTDKEIHDNLARDIQSANNGQKWFTRLAISGMIMTAFGFLTFLVQKGAGG